MSRLKIDRLDREYIIARGSGQTELVKKCVVVVGCGAVGSSIVTTLAAAGVGRITLVDYERFSQDNVHRHELGAESIGEPKVEAMRKLLEFRFPYIVADPVFEDIERLLTTKAEKITSADLVILATGDENLELRLNHYLRSSVPRIHSWVEPRGAGGHVLLSGFAARGCYQCLFLRKEGTGTLYNAASLVKPGQIVQITIPGCGGFFTPFNLSAAKRTAIEACDAATAVLLGRASAPELLSWRSSSTVGLDLSLRGDRLTPGCVSRTFDFGRADCGVCGQAVDL